MKSMFCRDCGEKMIGTPYPANGIFMEDVGGFVAVFNIETGERNMTTLFKCPNYRWWNVGHYSYSHRLI